MNRYWTKLGVFEGLGYNPSWGVLHRLGGPAVEYADGSEEWWVENVLHRADGPAVINAHSTQWWYNDHRHREDGPALVYSNGDYTWWLNDRVLTLEQYIKYNPSLKTDAERTMFYLKWK